ncbi:hypothetical protein C1H46_019058 [Malus baccata]|uniref:HTH OST-type domain-containing protein n=1 Tax=Malus baccata TaxID=106549 RepID=A0A540M983_MALBA|nr:hypothetical protein C1H46_019058 [Malus baccata]
MEAAAVPEWQRQFDLWFLILLDHLCESERIWTMGYPLARLKQDFRHASRLEIDHRSLGFNNLSGFISSGYSHLCTMERVGGRRNRNLIVRPIKTPPTRHDTNYKVADTCCLVPFVIAVFLYFVFTIDIDNDNMKLL